MEKVVEGIEFQKIEDHELFTEAMERLKLARKTQKEDDFKLSIRICEEIVCRKLRAEALRFAAEAIIKSGEVERGIKVAERTDNAKKAIIYAYACRQTGTVNYLTKAEDEAEKIENKRLKEFISKEILNIIAN